MKNEVNVTVSGDSGTDYPMRIAFGRSLAYIKCGCLAGQRGQKCKHAMDILMGDLTRIRNPEEQAAAAALLSKIDIEASSYSQRLIEIEQEEARIKAEKRKIREAFDQCFKSGFPFSLKPQEK